MAYETKVENKREYSVATGVLDIYTWWLEVKVSGMGREGEGERVGERVGERGREVGFCLSFLSVFWLVFYYFLHQMKDC